MADVEKNPVKEHKNGTDTVKQVEPSENDPCIEENKQKNQLWRTTEEKLRKKTGLSQNGLYVAIAGFVLLLVLFIIVIVLGICWPYTPHHHQYPICSDSACLRASAQVQEYLNASTSPCDDIWGWACGTWLSKHKLPSGRSIWNQRQELIKEEAARVRELVTTLPLPLLIGRVDWKLKYLYEACLDVDNVNADQEHPLKTIILELGGWHILRDWNSEDFDPKHVLQQLHVKYGVSPFFKIDVVPNPSFPGNSSIRVSPSGLGLPDRSYYYGTEDDPIQTAYIQLIRDVVINLSATKTEAERFGKNMYHYEKRIAEITPESYELENTVNTYHPIKLSEISLTAPSLPLQDILTAMFPDANIGGETEIIITSPDYLSKVSQIVATTDRAIMNSYIIWTLVREYLPYMSTKFTSSVDSFQMELLGVQQSLERWEFCVKVVQKFMGLGVEAFLEKRHPIKKHEISIVNDIFESIKNVIKERLNRYSTVRDLQRHLTNKISTLKLQIGLPADVTSEVYLRSFYNKLNVLKANLFQSYKNGIVFLKKIEERRLVNSRKDDYIISKLTSEPYFTHYDPSTNVVILPRAVLSAPYFEYKYPSSIIYGRLGVELAYAVVSSILPYYSSWTSDLKLLTPFHMVVNETITSLRYQRRCLKKYAVNHELATEEVANLTTLSTYKHLASISVAHEALNDVLTKENHVHQPSLEIYEDSALFYLSWAQTQCSILTPQQEHYENYINYRLSQKNLLQTTWHQIPEFPAAFECTPNNKYVCKDLF